MSGLFEPGWLKCELDEAVREVASWPDGMARRNEFGGQRIMTLDPTAMAERHTILADLIANIGYPVGMGTAPHPETVAAIWGAVESALFERLKSDAVVETAAQAVAEYVSPGRTQDKIDRGIAGEVLHAAIEAVSGFVPAPDCKDKNSCHNHQQCMYIGCSKSVAIEAVGKKSGE